MGDTLQLVEALSIERGALQERALLEGLSAEKLVAAVRRHRRLTGLFRAGA